MLATNLYGLVLGFAVSSLGFGFTRPGFTAGASLAVPLSEQGGVAGVVTAANGIAFVAAPAVGMALYHLDVRLPFAVSALLLAWLIAWGRARLD
jgi:MFS family permease